MLDQNSRRIVIWSTIGGVIGIGIGFVWLGFAPEPRSDAMEWIVAVRPVSVVLINTLLYGMAGMMLAIRAPIAAGSLIAFPILFFWALFIAYPGLH